MKIGDKVSFLSETGGGIVAGFQGKNIVLVEDSDGFQIPTPIKDVVVMRSEDYDIGKMVSAKHKLDAVSQGGSIYQKMHPIEDETADETVDEIGEDEIDDTKEVTFKAPVEEIKGHDVLSCFLAFVPMDIKAVTNTRFEVYFVNDSNYFVQYTYLTGESSSWNLRSNGEIEPNTKQYIEEIGREDLNEMTHITVQMLAYKRDKPFRLKPVVEMQMRLDPMKFYKLHTFCDNQFFELPALLYAIIENDSMDRPLVIDTKTLKNGMYKDQEEESPKSQKNKKDKDLIVVDLHATELLDNQDNLSHADILNYQLQKFRETIEQYKDKKGQKIVFIHGKGEGVLRHAIINDLNYRYKKCQYQDASFQEYGYGATQITIR